MSTLSIASLRSIYKRRQTLSKHQLWAKTYLGLRELGHEDETALTGTLLAQAADASHSDDLVQSASQRLFTRRIEVEVASLARLKPLLEMQPTRRSRARRRHDVLGNALFWQTDADPRQIRRRIDRMHTSALQILAKKLVNSLGYFCIRVHSHIWRLSSVSMPMRFERAGVAGNQSGE